jgi:hypothetical protein
MTGDHILDLLLRSVAPTGTGATALRELRHSMPTSSVIFNAVPAPGIPAWCRPTEHSRQRAGGLRPYRDASRLPLRGRYMPVSGAACRAAGSHPANERPTDDQEARPPSRRSGP